MTKGRPYTPDDYATCHLCGNVLIYNYITKMWEHLIPHSCVEI